MSLAQQVLVLGAGLVAGGINGVVGGGSLVSFPVLLAVGQPALAANVTSTVGIWPGYLGGLAGSRTETRDQAGRLRSLAPATLAGAAAGAVLLLTTSPGSFEAVTPYLILAATALFAAQPRLTRWVVARGQNPATTAQSRPYERRPAAQLATFFAAVYGAYFGAGLGIVLLAVLGILIPDRLVRTNGLRTVLSLAINTVAAAIFLARAPVVWSAVGLLGVGSLVGGFAGARLARWLPAPVLRASVVIIGLTATGRLLLG